MTKTILLSAYACEPHRGSEPAVGWHWAVEAARLGHQVWVITRCNNEGPIRQALEAELLPNLNFVYYDLPACLKRWKKGNRGVHWYYLLWQWGAYRQARELSRRIRFDLVHHVTFVSIRQPSFMGLLGLPFVFGPVAGGERAPWPLRRSYPFKGWLRDLARDVLNLGVRVDPLMQLTFRRAQKILVTSPQTRQLLPPACARKADVQLAIGIDPSLADSSHPMRPEGSFSILYVGHLLYLKGMHLGMRAFAQVLQELPEARLTMVGHGPDESHLRQLADTLGIAHAIEWLPWLDRREVLALYARHHALLFPSLHDSGGMVVLEALIHSVPVVCLDLGGPGVIVDESCGRVVATDCKREEQVIAGLAAGLVELATHPERYEACVEGAIARAHAFRWDSLVTATYRELLSTGEGDR